MALHGTDPVIFFESQRLYDMGEIFVSAGVPEEYYEVPLGEPALRREGNDLTICTIGAPLYRALEAADDLDTMGISTEVIDLRFITPLNLEPVIESIRKTGKALLVSDACERGSYLHTVASTISQGAFDFLDGPVATVGARNWITPPAELESSFFPQKEWILDTIHERIFPLQGHSPATVQTDEDLIRRYREGT